MPEHKDIGDYWVHQPATNKDQVIEEFQQEAAEYETNVNAWGYRLPNDSTKILERYVSKSAKILETGCGTGLPDLAHFEAGFTNLYGCDLTQEMLDKASLKNIHRKLSLVDLEERLPFEDNEFDCVTCLATLTYISNAEPTLREFCRITRAGGLVLFSQRNDLFEARDYAALIEKLEGEKIWKRQFHSDWLEYLPKHRAYTDNEIRVGYFLFEVLK